MSGNWYATTGPLREEFREQLDLERLRELHATSGLRHGVIAARQFLLAALAVAVILLGRDRWYVWLPAAVLLGFLVFSFTVLLHEVVHRAVFRRRGHPLNRLLAWAYALPSGLSPSQFERWHLDHHAELGTDDKDPKRHYLTPKIVRRWFKLLYFTPALVPIYFRAAAAEAASYPAEMRRRLRRERVVVLGVHLGVMAALLFGAGVDALLKAYVVPVFFVFPVAFTINRLGQHYDITPEDPAAWGTVIETNPVWNFLFLWSSFHIEHHYFPAVPFYNLAALHDELRPILARHPMRVRSYGGLLYDWIVNNRAPHLSWH